ncbi:MAG TPA: hypothetical protein VNJ02_12360 [Vicinamibacterales bacterium]|nr:hypothetical protein [Vicinamibacterales bacterium]
MADNRRTQLLAATVVVVLVAVIVTRTTEDQAPASARAARRPAVAAQAGKDAAGSAPPVDVNLEALKRPRGVLGGQGRNPFRFRARPLPPPPVVAPSAPRPADQSPGPVLPPVPTGPPPPPPIQLKLIGMLEKADGTKIAVLSDGRGPLYGVEGQEVAGRYKILRIGAESVEMAYIDGRGRQTIRLSGQ